MKNGSKKQKVSVPVFRYIYRTDGTETLFYDLRTKFFGNSAEHMGTVGNTWERTGIDGTVGTNGTHGIDGTDTLF